MIVEQILGSVAGIWWKEIEESFVMPTKITVYVAGKWAINVQKPSALRADDQLRCAQIYSQGSVCGLNLFLAFFRLFASA